MVQFAFFSTLAHVTGYKLLEMKRLVLMIADKNQKSGEEHGSGEQTAPFICQTGMDRGQLLWSA